MQKQCTAVRTILASMQPVKNPYEINLPFRDASAIRDDLHVFNGTKFQEKLPQLFFIRLNTKVML